MVKGGGGAVQVQDHSSPSPPLGLPSLDMGHRACSDHAKSLSSHAGPCREHAGIQRVDGQCLHMMYTFYEAHV